MSKLPSSEVITYLLVTLRNFSDLNLASSNSYWYINNNKDKEDVLSNFISTWPSEVSLVISKALKDKNLEVVKSLVSLGADYKSPLFSYIWEQNRDNPSVRFLLNKILVSGKLLD